MSEWFNIHSPSFHQKETRNTFNLKSQKIRLAPNRLKTYNRKKWSYFASFWVFYPPQIDNTHTWTYCTRSHAVSRNAWTDRLQPSYSGVTLPSFHSIRIFPRCEVGEECGRRMACWVSGALSLGTGDPGTLISGLGVYDFKIHTTFLLLAQWDREGSERGGGGTICCPSVSFIFSMFFKKLIKIKADF